MFGKRIQYADDDTNSVKRLVRLRAPSILAGLMLGIILSFVVSRFEEVLAKDIKVAFFIPFIVYVADAVGTQTQNIFARDLKTKKTSFKKYLWKETFVGIIFGLLSAFVSFVVIMVWLRNPLLAMAVTFAMFAAVAAAPLVALIVTESLQLEHLDPAVGAGPIATVIQDTLSVLIYGIIASAILL